MKLTIHKPVTVITPTIGKPELLNAVRSVVHQTYPCRSLVVVDGSEYNDNVWDAINPLTEEEFEPVFITTTVENTGKTGGNFYGHRIYAAYPHLINSDYILFLDEDNWYEPNHVETLINTIEENNLDFAFSPRKIYDKDGNYLCEDNCESLGKWPIYFTHDNPQFHVDTSSFCFKREFIQKTCHVWHEQWGADRRFFNTVRGYFRYDTSGKHTLCYRLDGNPNSVTKDFFDRGNSEQYERYGGTFPWKKT